MPTLRCFGATVALNDFGEAVKLRSRKHLGLLLYLLANRRTTHSRETLANLLWNGNGTRQRHSLSQALYDIKAQLGSLLVLTKYAVTASADDIVYEGDALERSIRSGDHATALRLLRGTFAPDLLNLGSNQFDRWLEAERARYQVLAAIALRDAQRRCERQCEWDKMCLAALRLIELNPYDERAHCALMRGLTLKGDGASALAHYRGLPKHLRLEEWTEARRLVQHIRACDRSNSNGNGTRSVPEQFVGRRDALKRLRAELEWATRGPRVVVIAGEPGVGKTRLLREFTRVVEVSGVRVAWLPDARITSPGPMQESGTRDPGRPATALIVDNNRLPDNRMLVHARQNSSLLVLTTTRSTDAARKSKNKGLTDEVIVLERLAREDINRLLALVIDAGPREWKNVASRLSGGNPGLGIAVVTVWELIKSDPNLVCSKINDIDATQKCLSASAEVRALIQERVARLTRAEKETALSLAMLGPTARQVVGPVLGTSPWCEAVAGLREKGWLKEFGRHVELAVPILGYALRLGGSREETRRCKIELARAMKGGDLHARLGAAAELGELGLADIAVEEARGVAESAMASSYSSLATAATELACRYATGRQARFDMGVMAAEAELDRGRLGRARQIAYALQPFASDTNERIRLDCIRARVTIAANDEAQCMDIHASLSDAAASLTPGIQKAVVSLHASRVRLFAAVALQHDNSHEAAQSLEQQISMAADVASHIGTAWIEGVTELVWYAANNESRGRARHLLSRFVGGLAGLSPRGRITVAILRAALEQRAGDLHAARRTLRSLKGSDLPRNSRADAVVSNNTAVLFMETGAFSKADEWLLRSRHLDVALGLGPRDRAHTLLNDAQCKFFQGKNKAARVRARAVRNLASEHGCADLAAQSMALLGLLDLTDADPEKAARRLARLELISVPSTYCDDHYLVEWLRAAIVSHTDPAGCRERLLISANAVETFDRLSALKLLTLRGDQEPRRELRKAGVGWFSRLKLAAVA